MVAESPFFINESLRDRIVGLGGVPVISDMESPEAYALLLNQLIGFISGPAAGIQTNFIYQPGGVTSGNIYATWAELMAAYTPTVGMGQKHIFIDDSLVSPAVIPAGNYTFDRQTFFHGRFDVMTPTVAEFADGVTVSELAHVTDVLHFQSNSTSPVITISGGGSLLIEVARGSQLRSLAGTTPMMQVDAGATLAFFLVEGGTLGDTEPVLNLDAGGVAFPIVYQEGRIEENSITGPVGSFVQLSPKVLSSRISLIQPGFSGSFGFEKPVIGGLEFRTTAPGFNTVASIPVNDNEAVGVEAKVGAKRTDADGRGMYVRRALVYREGVGAAARQGGQQSDVTREGGGGFSTSQVQIVAGAASADIEVRGPNAGGTVDWLVQVQTWEAS